MFSLAKLEREREREKLGCVALSGCVMVTMILVSLLRPLRPALSTTLCKLIVQHTYVHYDIDRVFNVLIIFISKFMLSFFSGDR